MNIGEPPVDYPCISLLSEDSKNLHLQEIICLISNNEIQKNRHSHNHNNDTSIFIQ